MHYKAGMSNLLTVVGLLVEPSTAIANPNVSLEVSIFISQPTNTVTSSNMVISP